MQPKIQKRLQNCTQRSQTNIFSVSTLANIVLRNILITLIANRSLIANLCTLRINSSPSNEKGGNHAVRRTVLRLVIFAFLFALSSIKINHQNVFFRMKIFDYHILIIIIIILFAIILKLLFLLSDFLRPQS